MIPYVQTSRRTQSTHFTCYLCQQEIKTSYQSDPLLRLQALVTQCGHIFHRKCLEQHVIKHRMAASGVIDPPLDPSFETICPICKSRMALDSTVLLDPALRKPSRTRPPELSERPHQNHQEHRVGNEHQRSNEFLQHQRSEPRRRCSHVEVPHTTTADINCFHEFIAKLEEDKSVLETALRQDDLEMEIYARRLKEFRSDLVQVVAKMDMILSTSGLGQVRASHVSRVLSTGAEFSQQFPDLSIQISEPTADLIDGEAGAITPAQLSSPTTSTVTMYSTVSRIRGNGSVSRTGSTATTNSSFHTAATTSSTASSGNQSTSSMILAPSGNTTVQRDRPNGMSSAFRQSYPLLPEPRPSRRNRVLKYFTNIINPGRTR